MSDWNINLGASTEGMRQTEQLNQSRSNFLSKITPLAQTVRAQKEADLEPLRKEAQTRVGILGDTAINDIDIASIDGKYKSYSKEDRINLLDESDEIAAARGELEQVLSSLPEKERDAYRNSFNQRIESQKQSWRLEAAKSRRQNSDDLGKKKRNAQIDIGKNSIQSLYDGIASDHQKIILMGDKNSDLNKSINDYIQGAPEEIRHELTLEAMKIQSEVAGAAQSSIAKRNNENQALTLVNIKASDITGKKFKDEKELFEYTTKSYETIRDAYGDEYSGAFLKNLDLIANDDQNPSAAYQANMAIAHMLTSDPDFAENSSDKLMMVKENLIDLRGIMESEEYNRELFEYNEAIKSGGLTSQDLLVAAQRFNKDDFDKLKEKNKEYIAKSSAIKKMKSANGNFQFRSESRDSDIKALAENFPNLPPEIKAKLISRNPETLTHKNFKPVIDRWNNSLKSAMEADPSVPLPQDKLNDVAEAIDMTKSNPIMLQDVDESGYLPFVATLHRFHGMPIEDATRVAMRARNEKVKLVGKEEEQQVILDTANSAIQEAIDDANVEYFGIWGDALNDDEEEAIRRDIGYTIGNLVISGYSKAEALKVAGNLIAANTVVSGGDKYYLPNLGHVLNNWISEKFGSEEPPKDLDIFSGIKEDAYTSLATDSANKHFQKYRSEMTYDDFEEFKKTEEYKEVYEDFYEDIKDVGVTIRSDNHGNIEFKSNYFGESGVSKSYGKEQLRTYFIESAEKATATSDAAIEHSKKSTLERFKSDLMEMF